VSSLGIAIVLLGLALGGVVITALIALRRARYRGQDAGPYAGFRDANGRVDNGHLVRLPCEGHCPGSTTHETDGAGGATCRLCGTPRNVLHGLVTVDDDV
jgi:hypothetical protein